MTAGADRLAELEVERQFLLRSLADLEREHAVGDVDDTDYETLRDGYTARAAATLREIERGSQPSSPAPKPWARIVGWSLVVVAVAIAAGLVLARSWGERRPSDVSPTGGIDGDGTISAMLSDARSSMAIDPLHSIEVFSNVLELDPDNVEAITYGAWLSVASALQSGNQDLFVVASEPALQQFERAIALDPTYADPHCFSAVVVFYREGGDSTDPAVAVPAARAAKPAVDECLALDPPQDGRALVEALDTRIDAILAGEVP